VLFRSCQRYFQKTYSQSVSIGTATDTGAKSSIAYAINATAGGFYFLQTMRASPTITLYGASGTSGVWTAAGGGNTAAATAANPSDTGFLVMVSSGLTVGAVYYGHWAATAEL
jgi:hypothetical protein